MYGRRVRHVLGRLLQPDARLLKLATRHKQLAHLEDQLAIPRVKALGFPILAASSLVLAVLPVDDAEQQVGIGSPALRRALECDGGFGGFSLLSIKQSFRQRYAHVLRIRFAQIAKRHAAERTL